MVILSLQVHLCDGSCLIVMVKYLTMQPWSPGPPIFKADVEKHRKVRHACSVMRCLVAPRTEKCYPVPCHLTVTFVSTFSSNSSNLIKFVSQVVS